MREEKDARGYIWIQDDRYDDFYYLKEFEHLVVTKVNNFSQKLDPNHYEAIIFEDETQSTIVARDEFATKEEAQERLVEVMEKSLKNRKSF